jgi:peptide/nickel transport system permease protein
MSLSAPDPTILANAASEVLGIDEAVARRTPPVGRVRLVVRRFRRNRMAVAGLVGIVLMFLLAYLGPYLSRWNYQDADYVNAQSGPTALHWFGTDDVGHDLYAQVMRGLQKSLIIGLLASALSTTVAAVTGMVSAYFGGLADAVITWFISLMQVFPSLLILIVVSPLFQGRSWLILVVALAAFNWMVSARVVRGMTLTLRDREFVRAARYMGVGPATIIRRHILPNVASILIVDATLNVAVAIIGEAFLSFLGFGVRSPDVSLGTVIQAGTQFVTTDRWYLFLIPASFLVVIILCVNFVGDGLRDALDPNSTGAAAR